jgi:2-keto-4-pentenoate hydratase/2-oxohepta-3-ene-1,7-dioic acid hydratase in catechol pathway
MKLCLYDSFQAGAVVEDQVYPVGDALVRASHLKGNYTMADVIEKVTAYPEVRRFMLGWMKTGKSVPLNKVKLQAPIYNPPSIWAAASNYKAHVEEMQARTKGEKVVTDKEELMAEFWLKTSASIIGPGETIILPKVSQRVDFETELCAVIGRSAKRVSEEDALDYVFGYTICWDISQRLPWGREKPGNTRNIRKGFDTFTPLGPWIVTKDEIADPQNLSIKAELNGELAMLAHTKDMICTVREQIRFLSSVTTLRPGDLISTGTPEGVRMLKGGDRLKGSIEHIGEMELFVRAEV